MGYLSWLALAQALFKRGVMTSAEKVKVIYKVTDTHIYGFFGPHRFLSNYHLHSIEYEGIIYPSTENAYQASKTSENWTKLEIASLEPYKAKSKGRSIPLREDWLDQLPSNEQIWEEVNGIPQPLVAMVRDKIMYDLNVIKFSNPYLKNLLLLTGDKYLEETNWWRDDYWGVWEGNGLNKLGRILMKIRAEIKQN
jgi:predicted NAD-dependent protein-ADP-ribosyltransferase YbiA (DUF1768 family)